MQTNSKRKNEKFDIQEVIADLDAQLKRTARREVDEKGKVKIIENKLELDRLKRKAVEMTVKIEKEYAEHLGKFLSWKRKRKLITVAEDYKLNELENEKLEKECQVINSPPTGMRAHLGEVYKFHSYFDQASDKDMYVVYVSRTIEPEEQISKQLARKIAQGFHPTPEEYEPEKTVYHRRVMIEREFLKYFQEI